MWDYNLLIAHLFLHLCEQDEVYQDNLEASVAVLKKLSEQWKDLYVKLSPVDPLRETLKNFRQKVPLSIIIILTLILW